MMRKIGAALVIAAGALALTGIAAPAYAGVAGDRTPNPGEVVIWRDAGFTGPLYDYTTTKLCYPNAPDTTTGAGEEFYTPGTPPVRSKLNDSASSIANYDATHYVRAYVDCNYAGAFLQMLPYGVVSGGLSYAYSSLGAFDDQLSSHQIAGP